MTNTDKPQSSDPEAFLLERYGPLLHGKNLWLTLGYVSAQSFRKAVRNGTVPVRIFAIENRRGRFAKTHEVAKWLTNLSAGAAAPQPIASMSIDKPSGKEE
ncbi:hypothetical protein [Herbaspirillum seropedicae]|uniref:hypothetical protein n=1 Tax=Herbaspirillum seropedicae TaxID=964 RepID=UPI00285A023C|nr:hypothetical protein [Herbaspirillum seropedicae]MDR6396871.1 hypothetical protein [Herbaspirillum seropedicae]